MPHTTKTTLLEEEIKRLRRRVTELERQQRDESDVEETTAHYATNRKQAEKSPRENKQEIWRLLDTIPHGIQECDTDGVITYSNPAHAKMCGYEEGEIVGKQIWELLDDETERDDLCSYLAFLVSEQPPPTPYISKNRTKDGRVVDVQVDWTYERDEQGNVTGFISAITDISELKTSQNELRESEERFSTLADSVGAVLWITSPDYSEMLFASSAYERIWGRSCESLYKSPKQWAESIHEDDRKRVFAALAADAEKGLFEEEYRVVRPDSSIRWIRDRVFPVTDDANRLVSIAGIAEDITQSKLADSIVRSEQRYRAVVENQTEFIVRHTSSGQCTFVNEAYCRLCGQSRDELIGTNILSAIPADERAMIEGKLAELGRGNKNLAREHQWLLPSGETCWTQWSDTAIVDGYGQVVEIQSIGRDFTEHKRAEDALRESEARFRNHFENAPDANLLLADGVLIDCNHAASTMLRGSREEIIGLNPEVLSPEFQPDGSRSTVKAASYIREAMQKGSKLFEWVHLRLDGTEFWAEIAATAITYNGQPALFGTWRDITDRKQAEAALLMERDLAQRYLDVAGEIIVAIDANQNITLINREGCQLLGCDESEIIGANWFKAFLPESNREAVCEKFDQLMQGELQQLERYENNVLTVSGKLRTISWHNSLLTDNVGRVIGTLSAGMDITNHKRAESALVESEERLDLAVRGTSDGLWDANLETGKEYWSPRFKELLGYGEDEIEATFDRFQELLHSEDKADAIEAIRLHLEENQPYDVEFRMQTKNDGYRWFQSRGEAFYNENGKPYRMAGSIRDITERKRAEEEIRQHQERLAHVTRLSTMGEMATGLAHELNQPLFAIANYCFAGQQVLADAESADQQQLTELFEKLTGQATRAGEIIRRLRALVSKRTAIRERVNIVDPIQEVLSLLKSDLRQGTVHVELKAECSNCVAIIDEIQIQQVLVNLIRNAVDAMSETEYDRRVLTISTSLIDDEFIEIAVCDTGKGIPIELADQVFEAFFSSKSEGMGMGLAISRSIIESHGGEMWMTPNSDLGATFHFTLPIEREGSIDD